MDMLALRRSMLMVEHRNYVFFPNGQGCFSLDVTEGQVLVVKWDVSRSNLNGWILNGMGCTSSDITQLRYVGEKGTRTLTVIQSGKVRVGAYSNNGTFAARGGTIKIRVL